MSALVLTLVVCLKTTGACRTIEPNVVHADDGSEITLMECLGAGGQDIARRWIDENPGHVLKGLRCGIRRDVDDRRS